MKLKSIMAVIAAIAAGLLLLFLKPAFADGERPSPHHAKIVAGIQKKYESIKNFSAEFVQETYQRSFDRTHKLEGSVYLSKPGRMRWDYRGDAPQQIVSDGKTLWFYQPSDKTVMKGDLKGALAGSVPFDFLTGMGKIEKDFTVSTPEKSDSQQGRLRLVGRPGV